LFLLNFTENASGCELHEARSRRELICRRNNRFFINVSFRVM